ncbi:hypothetical protein [Ruegeria lacuscaerulensis]|uniref:hypothetical protein n=1 Tax=Ruegeria lacuscaerulensis TaxID=55218 RepID=UPI00147A99EA|nr:hypothetical protein [Ruegeria lacuscaerulensis]
MNGSSLLEVSNFVRLMGLAYLSGLVLSTSGIFPAFGISLASKGKFAQAQTRIRRQQFGWGAGVVSDSEIKTKHVILAFPLSLLLIAMAYFGLSWAKNAQLPALNFALGFSFFVLGLYLRKQFLRNWTGRPWKLDFACFLIGLFFVIAQV